MVSGVVDFHTHLIPDIDDGVKEKGLVESIVTIKKEIEQGVTDIVCTSHYGLGNMGEVCYSKVEKQYALLVQAVKDQQLPVQLYLGAELFGPDNQYILTQLSNRKCHTIAGSNYVLVEFAEWTGANETAENITSRMIDLTREGTYRPILAHAERYRDFKGKEYLYDEMVNAGVKFQINLFDILGNKDPWVCAVSQRLLKEEKVFVIGSDTHGKKRPPKITQGSAWIQENCSRDYADAVLRNNAMGILCR